MRRDPGRGHPGHGTTCRSGAAGPGRGAGANHLVLESERDRLQLGVDAQLDQHVLHVGADGVEGQEALLGDPPVRPAVGQQAQDLPLAAGQGPHPEVDAGVAHGPGGRLGRGHDAARAVDQGPDGPGDLAAGGVLGQEAVGPGLKGLGDRLPAGVGREHQHPGAGRGRPDGPQGGGQVGTWHVGVEQQHGRLVPGRQLDRLVAVMGHPEDGQVILGVQHHSEALGEDPVVIREHQSDHVRHVTASPGAPQSLRPVLRPSCKASPEPQTVRPTPCP